MTRRSKRAFRAAHLIDLERQLDQRLATRRAERAKLRQRSRKGASTRIHRAFVGDVLRNEMVAL